MHLDVWAAPGLTGEARMAALEAEAGRLVSHGASRLSRHEPAPPLGAGHIVLADPEGKGSAPTNRPRTLKRCQW